MDKIFQPELYDIETGYHLLINKPLEWTSFDVVNQLRNRLTRYYGRKKLKVGHAGTLDPLATGLLILCVGKYTKRIDSYQAQEKEYTGTFYLGATTPSYDLEHPIDKTYPTDHITHEQLLATAKDFTGSIEQTPPVFSAVKVNGRRAYDYVRNQEDIKLRKRTVEIKTFEITRMALPEVDFRVVCSKGTYIRSLARDFGEALQSGAHLSRLCRTRIGDFSLDDAWELETIRTALETVEKE